MTMTKNKRQRYLPVSRAEEVIDHQLLSNLLACAVEALRDPEHADPNWRLDLQRAVVEVLLARARRRRM